MAEHKEMAAVLVFMEADGAEFKFKLGFDARSPIDAKIDFLEEFGGAALRRGPR